MTKKIERTFSVVVIVSIFCIVVFYFWRTSENDTAVKEITELAKTIKEYTADQRDEAVIKVKTELDDLDEKIDNLERKTIQKEAFFKQGRICLGLIHTITGRQAVSNGHDGTQTHPLVTL